MFEIDTVKTSKAAEHIELRKGWHMMCAFYAPGSNYKSMRMVFRKLRG